jgi:hypothetical protein
VVKERMESDAEEIKQASLSEWIVHETAGKKW